MAKARSGSRPSLKKRSRGEGSTACPHVTVPTCPLEGSAFAGRDGCPQPSVRLTRCGCRSGQRRVGDNPPYLNCPLRPSCPQVLGCAPCPHVTVPTCPLEGSAFAGRDGCPQPSVRRESCAPPTSSYSRFGQRSSPIPAHSGQRRVGDNPPYPRHRGDNPHSLNPVLPKNKAPRTKNPTPTPSHTPSPTLIPLGTKKGGRSRPLFYLRRVLRRLPSLRGPSASGDGERRGPTPGHRYRSRR